MLQDGGGPRGTQRFMSRAWVSGTHPAPAQGLVQTQELWDLEGEREIMHFPTKEKANICPRMSLRV